MDVKVLGPGCTRCKKLFEATAQAIAQVGVQATLTKVENLQEMMAYNIMSTPALVVDGVVKLSGRVPSVDEVATILRGNNPA